MPAGKVDRNVLASNYQEPGQLYDDKKTEAAFEVVAQQVDSNWDDYKVIKDKLASIIAGDSGAHNVGSAPIPNLAGANVYAQLADLMNKILSIQEGAVPSGTITPDKLSFDPDSIIKDAGGTANAITIIAPNYQYSDNAMLTFIADTNNAGAATTININSIGARPLYKPGTTSTPTLIAGKAYSVWFDATANCFFIKASAEGTAVAGHVLAGKTFSNDVDVGIEGTIPDYSNMTVDGVITDIREGQIWIKPPAGSFDGINSWATNVISGLNAANIKFGVQVGHLNSEFKVTGTLRIIEPGDGIIASADAARGVTGLTYVKVKSMTMNLPGTYRISFDLASDVGSGYGRIYKNGVAFGTERANFGPAVTFTEDLTFNAGDTVELWTHSSGNSGSTSTCSNFRIKMNTPTVTLN